MPTVPCSIFWFRRDLRLKDNHALFQALRSGLPVIPIFLFDSQILSALEDRDDPRVTFIFESVQTLRGEIRAAGSDLLIWHGTPLEVIEQLISKYSIRAVYANEDYEPYARTRDQAVAELLQAKGIRFERFKDQVIFAKSEILAQSGMPYTRFTPYFRQWLSRLSSEQLTAYPSEQQLGQLFRTKSDFPSPSLEALGFTRAAQAFPQARLSEERLTLLRRYAELRDRPDLDTSSRLGVHLRFGTLSIRELVALARETSETWLTQFAWRDFFHQLLFHFPSVVEQSFQSKFRDIPWNPDTELFQAWCEGQTGIPIIDAGMRELNQTGFMHNRVRMITASFLSKQMRIDWRRGERYFARKLLDYDLALNNGNWQWCAGTGCDAAPYFRIFNPWTQAKKFDPQGHYQMRWVPEFRTAAYPKPLIDHEKGRDAYLSLLKAHFG